MSNHSSEAKVTGEPSALSSIEAIKSSISLGRLLRELPARVRILKSILLHPFAFGRDLHPEEEREFQGALDYTTFAICTTFLLMVPIFVLHKTDLAKLTFLLRMLTQLALYGVLMHGALKLMGARASTLRGTLTVYGYLGSTGMMLFIVLAYPLYLEFGPALLLGGLGDVARIKLTQGYAIYLNVIEVLLIIPAFAVTAAWFSSTHHIGKFRVIVAILLAGVFGAVLQLLLVAPFFNMSSSWIEKLSGLL